MGLLVWQVESDPEKESLESFAYFVQRLTNYGLRKYIYLPCQVKTRCIFQSPSILEEDVFPLLVTIHYLPIEKWWRNSKKKSLL